MELAFVIILIIILLICSGYVSLSEIAFFSLPAGRVKTFRHQLDPRKRLIAKLLSQPKSLLVTLFLINTILNILVQNLSSDLFPEGSWALKVGVPLFLVLIFGEILPKYLGLIYSDYFSYKAAPTFDFIQRLTGPLRIAITKFTDFVSRICFFFLKAETPLDDEEMRHALKASMEKGLLQKEEAKFIQGYLELEEREVKELMVPKNEIPFYDMLLPLSKLHFLFSKQSEVLVCKENVDDIIGIIDSKTYFVNKNEIKTPQDLCRFVHNPYFVPETSSSKQLLQNAVIKNKRVALAVDEYGVISGIIYRERLIKELSNTDTQEHGKDEYSMVSKDTIVASGKLSLQEVRRLFSVKLISEYHAVTIGGYIIEQLGSIPKSGDTLQKEHLFFRILAASPTQIHKVYIQKTTKTDRIRKK